MSSKDDAQLRLAKHMGAPLSSEDKARLEALEAARSARVGRWSEADLEKLICSQGDINSEGWLRKACLGSGDMDRSLSLREAAGIAGVSEDSLALAAERRQLAMCGPGLTSETRLGAWMLSQVSLPVGDSALALRAVFLCGVAAGSRNKAF